MEILCTVTILTISFLAESIDAAIFAINVAAILTLGLTYGMIRTYFLTTWMPDIRSVTLID